MGSIYKILNTKNNKIYIGSAKYFPSRKACHIRLLRTNKHYNKHLQAAYNKYGEESMVFSVLETDLNNDILIIREQYFIDSLRPEYNKRLIAGSNLGRKYIMEEYHKEKIGKALRRLSDTDVLTALELRRGGMKVKDLAVKFNLHSGAMSKILNGRAYKNLCSNTSVIRKDIRPNKLSNEQKEEIYYRSNLGENQYKLAEEFGVNQSVISRIKNQKRNYKWLDVVL